MAPIVVLALVATLTVAAVVVFAAVVIAIHSEPRHQMATRAPGPLSALVRRLLGVHVVRPDDAAADDREECLTAPSTDWWNKGGWGQ